MDTGYSNETSVKVREAYADGFLAGALPQSIIQCQTLFWGAPKSLQMVIAVMKLQDAYSLEGKL